MLYHRSNVFHQIPDCYDHYTLGYKNDGLYKVKPLGQSDTIEVFCDMRKGGWTVIQRRQDGSTNFFQEWKNYKMGFGGKLVTLTHFFLSQYVIVTSAKVSTTSIVLMFKYLLL